MEKTTFSASTEKLGIIVSNYPIGSEVVLVSAKHESGFEAPLNVRYSTNANPYPIRFDWSSPLGKYTMRVTAAGTPYDLAFTVNP